MSQTYTCKGRGGLYELVDENIIGAGSLKGARFTVYRDVETNRLYVREVADFNARMELIDECCD